MSENPFSTNPTNRVQVQLKLSDTMPIKCGCSSEVFVEGLMFRRVSMIISGGAGDVIPIRIPICAKCKSPLTEFMPPELKPAIEV